MVTVCVLHEKIRYFSSGIFKFLKKDWSVLEPVAGASTMCSAVAMTNSHNVTTLNFFWFKFEVTGDKNSLGKCSGVQ